MANYKYSMDLTNYFAEKEEEKILPPETGIMKRNASKAEAQAKQEPAYEPYGFLPKFTQMLAASYPNEQAARTGLGLTRADEVAEDVRMKEIEQYISDASRATAIEDALMGLNLPETPQDMPSAGTLGPLEGDQTLPAAPGVSTSPLGPRSMGTPALTFDEVPTPMSLDPTVLEYATQSSLPGVEAIIDEIMLDRGGEKEITSETPEEREQYRGKGEGLMSKPKKEASSEWLGKELDKIMVSEGGFQNDKEDTGNYVNGKLIGTNKGITPAALAEYRGIDADTITVDMMKGITDEEARAIYEQNYYYKPKIDKLPQNLQASVFDMTINAGGNGVKILQRLAGVDADGVIGPQTIKAVKEAGITPSQYADARIEYYKKVAENDPDKKKYLKGWIRRANKYRE